jgi:hypothetical protein
MIKPTGQNTNRFPPSTIIIEEIRIESISSLSHRNSENNSGLGAPFRQGIRAEPDSIGRAKMWTASRHHRDILLKTT